MSTKIKSSSFLAICFAVLCCSLSLLGGPDDEHWSLEFGAPGTTNGILAVATHNEKLYVAGYTGGSQLTNATIDVWNGRQWSSFGEFTGGTVVIYDLAFIGNTLYAAGLFTNVSGVPARGLARWDGSSWSSFGFSGLALDLMVAGNNLYVGGSFTNLGGVLATNIAKWDGTNWHTLGDGLGTGGATHVGALLMRGNDIYAGGLFTNSGTQPVTNIAVWKGSSWSAVGGGVNGEVYDLIDDSTALFASGVFTQAGSTPVNRIAKWNGSVWSSLGTGLTGLGTPQGNALAFLYNHLCVTGSFTNAGGVAATNFAIWNGGAWASGGHLSGPGACIVSTGTNVYVGGNYVIAGGGIKNGIASWDGGKWRALGVAGEINGLSSSVRSLATDGTNIFAGGQFTYAGQTNAVRIGRYDGTNWHSYGTGLSATVTSVATVGTNVYVGGDLTPSKLLRWTGVTWASFASGSITSISSLAARGNDLFVAGNFNINTASGTNATWLARWDGANFHGVMAYDQDTFHSYYINGVGFSAMALDGANIYLSGNFLVTSCDPTWTDCTTSSNVVRFDGTYGRGMGTGLNTNATAIAVVGANVYFSGPFINTAGGVPVKGIARWDGNAWGDVGGGVVGTGTINALAAIGTNLYAGGSFTNIGGVPAKRLAKWNGTTWSALGSGTAFNATAGPVFALKAVGTDLYVGGTFLTAGERSSRYIARWNESRDFGPMRLANPRSLPDGDLNFGLKGLPINGTYSVEASTNLNQWQVIHTGSVTETNFIDSQASENTKRFYRLVRP